MSVEREVKEVKHIAEIGWRAFALALITLAVVASYYAYITYQIANNPNF
jgi:hypothetical protein